MAKFVNGIMLETVPENRRFDQGVITIARAMCREVGVDYPINPGWNSDQGPIAVGMADLAMKVRASRIANADGVRSYLYGLEPALFDVSCPIDRHRMEITLKLLTKFNKLMVDRCREDPSDVLAAFAKSFNGSFVCWRLTDPEISSTYSDHKWHWASIEVGCTEFARRCQELRTAVENG